MKFLIAGLGNIGDEYAGTRHNIGFDIADTLLFSIGKNADQVIRFESARYAFVAEAKFRGKTMVIIKPATYMNLSGNAVNYWMQKENIPKENILVLSDDLALPFGTLRVRSKGGDGGHNGLKHIAETLGSSDYPRLRFGIGSEFNKGSQVNYVLGKWSEEEKKGLPDKLITSVEIIKSFVMAGIELTMTNYNKL